MAVDDTDGYSVRRIAPRSYSVSEINVTTRSTSGKPWGIVVAGEEPYNSSTLTLAFD